MKRKINKLVFFTCSIIGIFLSMAFVTKIPQETSSYVTLCGLNQKKWKLINMSTSNDSLYTCLEPNPMTADNTYLFKADHTFDFSSGSIKSYNDCTDHSVCSGTWDLVDGDQQLNLSIQVVNGDTLSVAISKSCRLSTISENQIDIYFTISNDTIYGRFNPEN